MTGESGTNPIESAVTGVCRAGAVLTIRALCGGGSRWAEAPDPDSPTVYYANHASNLDGPLVWAAMPPAVRNRSRLVAASDYWGKADLRGYVAGRVFGALLIARRGISRRTHPVPRLAGVLEGGGSLIIFPEGTRDHGERVGPFKPGLHRVAKRVPTARFVPAFVQNLHRVLPKGEVLPVPILASVTFGPALSFEPDEPRDRFMGRLRDGLVALAGPAGRAA